MKRKGMILPYFFLIVMIIVLSFMTITYILKTSGKVNAYIVRADSTRKAELLYHVYTHDKKFITREGVLDGEWLEENDARKLYLELYERVGNNNPFEYVEQKSFNPKEWGYSPYGTAEKYKIEFSSAPIGFCEYDHAMMVKAETPEGEKEWYIGNIRFEEHMEKIDKDNLLMRLPDLENYDSLEFFSLVDLNGNLYPAKVEILVFDQGRRSTFLCLFAKAFQDPGVVHGNEMVVEGEHFIIRNFEIKEVDDSKYAAFVWQKDVAAEEEEVAEVEWQVLRDVSYLAEFPDLKCENKEILGIPVGGFIHKSWNNDDEKRQLQVKWDGSDFCGTWKNDDLDFYSCETREEC